MYVVLVPYTHTYLFVLAGYADATHDDSSSYIFGQYRALASKRHSNMYLLITFEPGTVRVTVAQAYHGRIHLLVQRSKLVLHMGFYSYVLWCRLLVPMVLVILLAAVNHTACTRI